MLIVKKINNTYKMGKIRQINIKNWTYYFYNDIIDLKKFNSNLLKITKKSYKTLVFTTLDISQLKKMVIVKIFTVWIVCICVLIMQVDILKKEMETNT